jgi:dolichyl-phosphate beta-glucosyltransferase
MSTKTPISLSVIVPSYNEEARLPGMLAQYGAGLPGDGIEILVVDDGSTDRTSSVVRELANQDGRVRLIRLPVNRGKGFAVRVGVLSARGDRILFADADGATPIGELRRLEQALDAGADVAIGSRESVRRAAVDVVVRTSVWRRLSGRIFHQVVRLGGVKGIVDTQCGFKLFTSAAAATLFPRMRVDGFAFDVELLLLAQSLGLRITEVPVNWTHQPGSKVNVVRDGLTMAADVLRLRARARRAARARRSERRAQFLIP